MSEESKCLGHIEIYIENGKVVTFVDGERMPDYTPIRAKLVYQKLLTNGYQLINKLDHATLHTILFYDDVVTKELMIQENVEFDNHFDIKTSDYKDTCFDTLLERYENLKVIIDDKFIEGILQAYAVLQIERG